MNQGPLHPLTFDMAGRIIRDRLHWLFTVDGKFDVWWDPAETNGLNYLVVSATYHEWFDCDPDAANQGLLADHLHPVIPYVRGHHSLTQ